MRAREHVAETLTIVHTVKVVIRRGVDGVARGYGASIIATITMAMSGCRSRSVRTACRVFLPAGGMSTKTVNAPPRTAQLWMHLIDPAECLTTGRAPPWLPSTV
jgi:hypothetical protein